MARRLVRKSKIYPNSGLAGPPYMNSYGIRYKENVSGRSYCLAEKYRSGQGQGKLGEQTTSVCLPICHCLLDRRIFAARFVSPHLRFVVRIQRFAPLACLLINQIVLTFSPVRPYSLFPPRDSNVRFDPLAHRHNPTLFWYL